MRATSRRRTMAGDGRPGPRPAVAPLTTWPNDPTPAVVALLIDRRLREVSEVPPVAPPIAPPPVVPPPVEVPPADAPPVVDTPDVEVPELPGVVLPADVLPGGVLPDVLLPA